MEKNWSALQRKKRTAKTKTSKRSEELSGMEEVGAERGLLEVDRIVDSGLWEDISLIKLNQHMYTNFFKTVFP